VDADFGQVHIQQIGPAQEAFLEFWADEVRQALMEAVPARGA